MITVYFYVIRVTIFWTYFVLLWRQVTLLFWFLFDQSIVAFNVTYQHIILTLNINTPDNVVYDKFFFNYGYVYNTHSGFFTAPSARLYIFTWTSIFAPWKIIDAEILVNGKQKGLANCNNDYNPRYENWTNKRPLVLNAGNKVNIRTLLQIFCIGLVIVIKDIKFS